MAVAVQGVGDPDTASPVSRLNNGSASKITAIG
jgi:hypothetical protein